MKNKLIFVLIACLVALLQTAAHMFRLEWLSLLFTWFLYGLAGYLISRYSPKLNFPKLLLLLIPYFALIAVTEFRLEDIPEIGGAVTGLGLSYFTAHYAS